jgi:acetylornithine deacetylase/succinyl-diaminopimelate desuccinylase-like protein
MEILAPADHPNRANIVLRLRGRGHGKPMLLIGHLDVVGTEDQAWTVDPFKLTETEGYYYGRGTLDMKGEDAAILTGLVRMKREGFVPDRDIVAAFTADEEAGDANGVEWLLKTRRGMVDAGIAINPDEGAAGTRNGRKVYYGIQTSTKRYVSFVLSAHNKGGATSTPRPDNAIYELAQALVRFSAYRFPIRLSDTTRAYFQGLAGQESGQVRRDLLAVSRMPIDGAAAARLAENPERNAAMRTTCVASLIGGGSQENALPGEAHTTIQCRLLPGDEPEDVARTLRRVVGDPGIAVTMTEAGLPSPEPAPQPDVIARVRQTAQAMWPGLAVMPTLNIGSSDSVYTRAAGIPTFGLCSIFYDLDDDRMHAADERIGVAAYYEGVEFTYRLMKALSTE